MAADSMSPDSGGPDSGGSDSVVAGLDEAWTAIRSLLHGLGPDDWRRPTACAEWDVFGLAAHLAALEAQFQGLAEPAVPEDPTGGIDAWTAAGVAARRGRSPDEVLAELEQASTLQVERLRSLDAAAWEEQTVGPLGPTTRRGLAETRLFDVYLHLLDFRDGLGIPLDPDDEPLASEAVVERVLGLTPWGAVKKARLPDGSRVRLDLAGRGGRLVDVVVEAGRGALSEPEGDAADTVVGAALAYTLAVTGRSGPADAAGGVKADGSAAQQLLDDFRVFG